MFLEHVLVSNVCLDVIELIFVKYTSVIVSK